MGERLLPGTGEPEEPRRRGLLGLLQGPCQCRNGQSDTAGRAERSQLGMLSGGQAPRWAPVSRRGSNLPGRYLPGWGRSILRLTR